MRQIPIQREEPTSIEPDPDAEKRILGGLNERQQEAVKATDGPVMIIAGPGSGKTRTLTHRIAYLLATGRAEPHEIIALTFTNKAAREMQERVQKLVGDRTKGMWVGTFHSSFARVLRIDGEKIGYSRDFSIYDTDDSKRIIKQQMNRLNISTDDVSPRGIQNLISDAKNRMVSPEKYESVARGRAQEAAAKIYPAYETALRKSNAMDFDDLLLRPLELFDEHPDVLQKYQDRWQYVHIDEYQDTNHAQYMLARNLADAHENLCVVGDDAQSIYAFRGADITNILSFEKDFPEATTVRLEQNYRSTGRILALADSIIKQNDDQLDKDLWTENDDGEYVALMEALSEKDEAKKIERRIRDLHVREGLTYGDFAVLYRTNAQSRPIEEALRKENIPYQVIGGTPFYQRKEIKDALAYLRLVVNPNDTANIQRVINYPTRGIGKKTQERLQNFANKHGFTLWQAIERVEDIDTLSTRAKNAVESFRFLIAKYASKAESMPADELAQEIIRDAGLLSELRKDHTRENLMRWENVQDLVSGIADFVASSDDPSLNVFLQEIALMTSQDEEEDTDQVTLMTLHASKGLEFPVVFVAGMEEGLFPLEMAAKEKQDLEEERRLFYVGATRAEEYLFLSWARSRYRYGDRETKPRSRFLDEIDSDVVRTGGGGELEQKKNRFSSSGDGDTSTSQYDGVDPHYYRQNLRDGSSSSASRGKKRKLKRIEQSSSDGRRVVYDEGQGEIVPGVRVEHSKFGEGKVQDVEGKGDKATAVVFFGSGIGNKKLKLKYARLRIIG